MTLFTIGWALILSVPIYYTFKFVAGFYRGVRHELEEMKKEAEGEDDHEADDR